MTRRIVTSLESGPLVGWTLHHERPRPGGPTVVSVPATVPGCVHTDLLAHDLIPDPFADTNEADLMWVASSEWRYRCTVEVTDQQLAHERVELRFDGLDTLATVRCNGHVVGTTANMHRRYRFDVTDVVRSGPNELEVVFASAIVYTDALRAVEGEWPSASFGRSYNYLRKMACSWGWDWGPWLTTAGIWRSAALVAWSTSELGDVRPTPTVDFDDRGSVSVDVDLRTTLAADTDPTDRLVSIELSDPNGEVVASTTMPATGAMVAAHIDAGIVDRWWPHTYGDQPLYRLRVRLLHDGVEIDRVECRIGFRTIELDTTADLHGSAFTFVVNGRPIFVRGVNWIPDDIFVSRITDDDYRQRLTQAVDANVDMIRIWGGGIYEDDRFYEACDELGLLVWQDFLFACAAYPEHLLADEVEAESRDNVSRLMHHASLAIWNGNNENIWGFWDWSWQDVLHGRSWGAGFYHETLPAVCAALDPARPYWPGSPYSGTDDVSPNADAHGCVHVWDVWNDLDVVRYRDHTPRFVSEFGWQAPPSMVTMAEVVSADQLHRGSPAWLNHQKAADGDLKLDRGIHERFGEVTDFEAFWYAAQVVQARAITTGVEHFRSLRPYCMGTIWWQLNDCWPVTSWAVIDSASHQKPSYYALREAYRAQLLTVQPRGDRLVLFALNESASAPWHVTTTARRLDLSGAVLAEAEIGVRAEPGGSVWVELPGNVAVPGDPTNEVLIVGSDDQRTWWWFAHDQDLRATDARIAWTARRLDDEEGPVCELTAVAAGIVRDLTISPERVHPDARIDRQLVHLEPGVAETFRITGLADDLLDGSMAIADLAGRLTSLPVCWTSADAVAPR